LDAATKAVVDSDDVTAQSMTAPVDGHLARKKATRRAPDPAASELGLRIDALHDAAQRLETLDGQDGLQGVARAVDVHGRSDEERSAELRLEQLQREAMDGEYFGTFSAGHDSAAKPEDQDSSLIAISDPSESLIGTKEDSKRPNYLITRGGVDQGPFSLNDLVALARKGELVNADTLTLRSNHSQMLAVDHPRLREVFSKRAEAQDLKSGAINVPIDPVGRGNRDIVSTRTTPKSSSSGTLLWLVIAIVVFAAAGWVLWQRSGAG
jgi:hypothetical protein